jgi:hypothetical protein
MHCEYGDCPHIGDCCEDVAGRRNAHLASPEQSNESPALANKEGLPTMHNNRSGKIAWHATRVYGLNKAGKPCTQLMARPESYDHV